MLRNGTILLRNDVRLKFELKIISSADKLKCVRLAFDFCNSAGLMYVYSPCHDLIQPILAVAFFYFPNWVYELILVEVNDFLTFG